MRTSGKFVLTSEDWAPAGGRWWRFDKYELRDNAIRPAAGAKLETYDPWKLFFRGRRRGQEVLPPYAEFVNLRERLGGGFPAAEQAILSWCNKYGLLGILLHESRNVTLAPRWVAVVEDGSLLVPGQVQYVRTNTGWAKKQTLWRPHGVEHAVMRPELEGVPVPTKEARTAWARTGVLRQPLNSADHLNERLTKTWRKFFPDVTGPEAEIHRYPMPLSPDFWNAYGEPYSSFLRGLQCFSEVFWELGHHGRSKSESDDPAAHVAKGVALLNALLAPASVTLIPKADGTFAQEWVCGSLLSAFAMMAVQDLTENRRVRYCASGCSRLFISQHPAALYCSDHCRWKTQKRQHRKRKPKNEAAGEVRAEEERDR